METVLSIKEYNNAKGMDVFLKEYEDFKNHLINSENSISLYGNPIVFDPKQIGGLNERFMHAVSCKEKDVYKNNEVLACNNELSNEICLTRCKLSQSNFNFKKIGRVECLYRLSRIHWVSKIIDMANEYDPKIKVWRYEKKDNTNNRWEWKWYLRYKEPPLDFLIVLREDVGENKKIELNFRTAYPLFLNGDKTKIFKEYNKAMKDGNAFKSEKPAFV